MGRRSKLKRRLARAVKVAAALAVVWVALELFVVQHGRVKLKSMEPALHDGDWVLFDKTVVRRRGLRRFDIVVFKAPADPDKIYIKRVVGLPNEVVRLTGGVLLVDSDEIALPAGVDWEGIDYGPAPVEAAHYFVLGDNAGESEDSRAWGDVPRDYILGRVMWRFWPVTNWKVFRRASAWTIGFDNSGRGETGQARPEE